MAVLNKKLSGLLLATVSTTGLAMTANAQEDPGFAISIGGETVAGDRQIARQSRKADVQLAKAELQVRFDGLGVKPRLSAVIAGNETLRAGQVVRVESQLNYPAFVQRGEFRLVDYGARGGPKVLQVIPVTPNGAADIRVPEGRDVALVHRVYDARGRFDETAPLRFKAEGRSAFEEGFEGGAPEEGVNDAVRRRIPVYGGAVTVSGENVRAGARVQTLGETVKPDSSGAFVIQRILPAGERAVEVQVTGAGESTRIERDISIPRSEWFYVGLGDVTWGHRFGTLNNGENRTYSYGRLAGYAKGRTQGGWVLTGMIDTNEEQLGDLFRNFDRKDPKNVLLRMAREGTYPEFGDDSTIEDAAPTLGKSYLRAERNGNHVMWGTYKSTISGGYYLRNERTLYGAQAAYRSAAQTDVGEARLSLEAYAAKPDFLPGRENFRGTGGSVYFLQRQDIRVASETLSVELRDKDTGRVLERRQLTEARDYKINYVQGVISLSRPLQGSGNNGLISQPGGDVEAYLVANYEYTPTAGLADGLSYGGRVEAWPRERVRFGLTGLVEQTGVADQKAYSVDLRLMATQRSYLDLEYARTEGPGFGASTSDDGGLIIRSDPTAGTNSGTGSAFYAKARVDFNDFGMAMPGTLDAYYERRTGGFSTLDYETRETEKFWGLAIEAEPSERVRFSAFYDEAKSESGKHLRKGGLELGYDLNARTNVAFAVEHLDKRTPGSTNPRENGKRTDVGLRVTHEVSDRLTGYLFGQHSVSHSGGLGPNDRAGLGVVFRTANDWVLEAEVSGGSGGLGAALLANYERDAQNSSYIGYKLDPGREVTGETLLGRDRGRLVMGTKRQVSERTDYFAENSYDMFGGHKSLTSAYGVEYRHNSAWTFTGAFDYGQLRDPDGDVDRRAISFGLRYEDPERLTARARLELRRDTTENGGTAQDQDSFLVAASARYKIDETQRVLFTFEHAQTEAKDGSTLESRYTDLVLGYALRPVDHDRFNLLFQYRYLNDMFGQRIDGTDRRGARQESHVLSVDMEYDLDQTWSLGGKLGGRKTRSAPDGTAALARNDAWLAVVNARYHLTHNWDILLEARHFETVQGGTNETGFLGAAYRHIGPNLKLGIGYNSTNFSDDLTNLNQNNHGIFLNLIAKF